MRRILIATLLTIAVSFLALGHWTGIGRSDTVANVAKQQYPKYCCTNAGKLGPYENNSVKEGEPCYGTDSKGQRHEGKACLAIRINRRNNRAIPSAVVLTPENLVLTKMIV